MANIQADILSRIRTAFYGLAICDALGGPLEFKPRRPHPSQYTRTMMPNTSFGLPKGHFTDDTSMALCLAASLTKTAKDNLQGSPNDPVDQAARYVSWRYDGYMSSVPGYAFDVGIQTSQALQYWQREPDLKTLDFVKQKFDLDWRGGNGSLMRVLPTALIARSESEAMDLAKRSSEVTHSHRSCVDGCAVYAMLVFWALRGEDKKQLVERLRVYLSNEDDARGKGAVKERLEIYKSLEDWNAKKRQAISSSGYVVDSLEAALWVLFSTDDFQEGAIEVVNLGDDADTVGAIYGGIAGAFYGRVEVIPEEWMADMKKFEMVEDVVNDMLRVVVERSVES